MTFIKNIGNILTGRFLTEKNSFKVWNTIIFFSFISMLNITNSHIMSHNIKKYERLSKEICILKHNYKKIRKKRIKEELCSSLKEKFDNNGLEFLKKFPGEIPKKN